MSNDPRVNKVYKVTFGAMENGEEQQNLTSEKVIAKDVPQAIGMAINKLSEEDRTTYFAQEVEIITYLD